jgi:dTDP-4-amino-4,6-dideoxygalactose transaminase
MYIVGEEEIEAVTRVLREGTLFRYGIGGECDRFEARYAAYLGVKHFALATRSPRRWSPSASDRATKC